jgi:pyruvate dehydrogenase E2 component (dihydrolipoamide acetyltransferase)
MSEFRMPSLGADMESGTLIEWLVKAGDRVHRGDIVAVVETDKGAIEIEIFEDAVVAELLIAPDTEVAIGTPLARLDRIGEGAATPRVAPATPATPPISPAARTPSLMPTQPAAPTRPLAPTPPRTSPPTARPAAAVAPATAVPPAGTRRKISPAARQHAREHGVDLDRVVGTGDGGVVTVADVEQFIRAAQATPAPTMRPDSVARHAEPAAPTQPAERAEPTARGQPVAGVAPAPTSPMRRAIAAAMSRSKRDIPHYYLGHTIDLEPALAWLERRNAQRPIERRVVYGALLLKAVARAAAENPVLNGHWRDGAFEAGRAVNVGVVIALRGGGLAAPALANAAALDVDALMAALKDATERARRGRLKSSELASATITVSSLGDTGVESIYPIIHPPQVAIVGVGAVVRRPWVADGGLFVRRVVSVTLAADHRASDGHDGARFLTAIERLLTKPEDL